MGSSKHTRVERAKRLLAEQKREAKAAHNIIRNQDKQYRRQRRQQIHDYELNNSFHIMVLSSQNYYLSVRRHLGLSIEPDLSKQSPYNIAHCPYSSSEIFIESLSDSSVDLFVLELEPKWALQMNII